MPAAPTPIDPSLSLALATVCASPSPLLMLDGAFCVLAVSASFCEAFNIAPRDAVGHTFFELGRGEWDRPQLRALMTATAWGEAQVPPYEFELEELGADVRRLVLDVRKLAYSGSGQIRLLVGVSDVTEARSLVDRDRALSRDNDLLLQEVRHRVANSLQIVASVMMMNARRTSSEETRGHLRDAHSRVMSVAELQQQLSVSNLSSVSIAAYLTRLCATISASMIADPDLLSISVSAPESAVDAETSVSLGLIVTELVINALKHGFPNGAAGTIDVEYWARGPEWTLSVTDTGVGMPSGSQAPAGGLGTSIVQALSRQLQAVVEVGAQAPGTRVSVVHRVARPFVAGSDVMIPQLAV